MGSIQEIDVAVVGAGISSVTAGYYIQQKTNLTYAIFESRHEMGGTWSLYKYPGIRSDSDMYSFGFPFNPWSESKSIAQGHEIRQYVEDTATKFGIKEKVQFHHQVKSASWSSNEKKWTLQMTVQKDDGVDREMTVKARFIYSCAGYYNYEKGYYPDLPGGKSFQGSIVRPQFWPEDLDYTGQTIAVIGSGATAVSMIPVLAQKAKKVTMVQRSPSYVMIIPLYERWPLFLRKHLPSHWVDQYLRFSHMLASFLIFLWCRIMPSLSRRMLRYNLARFLPPGVPLDPHFNPKYLPWEQRLCMIPDDGEFFDPMAKGKFDITTGVIESLVPHGIRMADGNVVPADIIVQATGLEVQLFGGIQLIVDGSPVKVSDHFQYRGMMLDGVPNFASCFGYIHSSWTLGANLCSQYLTRLLAEMEAKGHTVVTPKAGKNVDISKKEFPLSSGYLIRALDRFPKVSDNRPWTGLSDPITDWYEFRFGGLTRDLILS